MALCFHAFKSGLLLAHWISAQISLDKVEVINKRMWNLTDGKMSYDFIKNIY